LKSVAEKYPFRTNDYYLSLINWNDPADPIRRIVIPQKGELDTFGRLDPSNESTNYAAPGCQHKYRDTALLLVNEVCGCFCRFCFRKRLFMNTTSEVELDPAPGIDYIRKTPQISNVLITGGDPLLLSTGRLEGILSQLRSIEHVKVIRIGSKMPAFNPYRITTDPELLSLLKHYSSPRGRIYLMTHFNHPRELTPPALQAVDLLQRAGIVLANQTPVLKGINADEQVLTKLMGSLSTAGIPPYYFFQCRPTVGNKPFEIPLVKSYQLVSKAMRRVSGLGRRARFIMSHASGKVEVVGLTARHIFCRYHRSRRVEDEGRFMIFKRSDEAYWLDDLTPEQAHSDLTFRY
jgi:KamA family protein